MGHLHLAGAGGGRDLFEVGGFAQLVAHGGGAGKALVKAVLVGEQAQPGLAVGELEVGGLHVAAQPGLGHGAGALAQGHLLAQGLGLAGVDGGKLDALGHAVGVVAFEGGVAVEAVAEAGAAGLGGRAQQGLLLLDRKVGALDAGVAA